MMWPARAAIRPVPSHAVVPAESVEQVESDFGDADDLEARVERAFSDLDRQQPAVARHVARQVDAIADETAQALGHFLGVAVFEAFRNAFGGRVRRVEENALEFARATLECDEELRKGAADEALESDDLVAIAQPALLAFVRTQLEAALEPDEDGDEPDVDVEAIESVYRAVLVEIMAFSATVAAPQGARVAQFLA